MPRRRSSPAGVPGASTQARNGAAEPDAGTSSSATSTGSANRGNRSFGRSAGVVTVQKLRGPRRSLAMPGHCILSSHLVRPLLFLLVLGLVMLALLWLFQRRLVYLPLDRVVPPARDVLPGARRSGSRRRTGSSSTAGCSSPTAAVSGARCSSSTATPATAAIARRSPKLSARAGLAVLLIDYRGYGDNAGSPSEDGLRHDADAALDLLVARGYALERIAYFGESLGSAVAVELATRRRPGAVVLRSPFTSLADVGRIHYPFLPVRLLLRDRFASIDRVAAIGAPLLVIAGDRDSIVPLRSSRALFDAATGAQALGRDRGGGPQRHRASRGSTDDRRGDRVPARKHTEGLDRRTAPRHRERQDARRPGERPGEELDRIVAAARRRRAPQRADHEEERDAAEHGGDGAAREDLASRAGDPVRAANGRRGWRGAARGRSRRRGWRRRRVVDRSAQRSRSTRARRRRRRSRRSANPSANAPPARRALPRPL